MPETHTEPATERRMGIVWCLEHHEPVEFCCAHRWGGHNALRKYTNLMIKGKAHPFIEAGGALTGAKEGPEAIQLALGNATTERVALSSVVATQPVTPPHVGLMIRGKAPEPRTGNHLFEHSELPTFIRMGERHVIADGHHRLAATWARGDSHVKGRIVTGITPTFNNSDGFLLKP